LSGKEFQEDGAAMANARLARCLCVVFHNRFGGPWWLRDNWSVISVTILCFSVFSGLHCDAVWPSLGGRVHAGL